MELEPKDEFERELSETMMWQPAPPSLKRKIMERRWRDRARQRGRMVWWQRLAASVVLAGVAGGAVTWRNVEQRRKGEEAKRQVFTALRVANRALQQVNKQLQERNRNSE